MSDKTYNGWTNYETWAVNLWMDNEQGSQDFFREFARHFGDNIYELSKALQQYHEDEIPNLTGFTADLLNAAMSEVNWREIAQHLVDAMKEEQEAA